MAGRDNGQITVAWDKPSTNTSRILDYTITWPGGGPVVVDGGTTSFPVTGLDNNPQYVFTIKAQNAVGYSLPRTSGPMQPLGTPPAPAAPAVTDLESGANQTNIRIAWQAVLPEGPGPTVYTVSYTNGVTSGAVPGCQRLASLTCTHAGVPYDGLTYTYTVVAANQPGDQPGKRSQPSPGTSIEAVGRPADWGAVPGRRDGDSPGGRGPLHGPGLARLDEQGGDPGGRGSQPHASTQQTGTNTQPASPRPSNEQPYQVQLRVCNEEAPAGCTLSGVQNVQTYGRLDGMLNDIGPPSVNGKTLTWTITGTSNGDPASSSSPDQRRADQVIAPRRSGRFSFTSSVTVARNFDQDVTHRGAPARPLARPAAARTAVRRGPQRTATAADGPDRRGEPRATTATGSPTTNCQSGSPRPVRRAPSWPARVSHRSRPASQKAIGAARSTSPSGDAERLGLASTGRSTVLPVRASRSPALHGTPSATRTSASSTDVPASRGRQPTSP